MKRYRVMNRITKKWYEGEAESAQAACTQAGWLIGDCWIREYSPKGSGGWKVPEELRKKQASEPDCKTCEFCRPPNFCCLLPFNFDDTKYPTPHEKYQAWAGHPCTNWLREKGRVPPLPTPPPPREGG